MSLRTVGSLLLAFFGIAGVASLTWQAMQSKKEQEEAKKEGPVKKLPPNQLRMNKLTAQSYGIEDAPVRATDWQPRLTIDGRVVPNPDATLEIRAPFAGILNTSAEFRLGAQVKRNDKVAEFEARFSPLEKLDLKSKTVEAEARHKGAEDVLKIRQERMQRLESTSGGSIARADIDTAAIQLSEAKTQKDIALAQWDVWKQALASAQAKTIVVPIKAPFTGEIAEIGAQSGANVEAGQLLVKLVDFSRILVRLDLPIGVPAPQSLDIDNSVPCPAVLRGHAPSVEAGLQKAGYFYQIVPRKDGPAPNWRPGLYVKASINDTSKGTKPAIAVPASAVLLHMGRTLVYLKIDEERYERREVKVLGREGDTVFISKTGDWLGDERVVSRNAEILLSEEFRSDNDDV
jgi:RND family efflux transporter MFP subunit